MRLIDLKGERLILLACGSFNPPTRMHLNMFELARRHLEHRYSLHVVEGIMSPVADPFGKADLLPAYHRMKMAELAAKNCDWIRADDYECSQKQWMRTINVLEYHQRVADERVTNGFPKSRVVMLCGGDLVDTFTRILPNGDPLWQIEHLRHIIINNGIVVVSRPGSSARHTIGKLALLDEERANVLFVEDFKESDISSTRVRESLRRGDPIDDLVHPNVEAYIREHYLFANDIKTLPKKDSPVLMIQKSVDSSKVLESLHHINEDNGGGANQNNSNQ